MNRGRGQYNGVNRSAESSIAFAARSAKALEDAFSGKFGPKEGYFVYGRHCHPTVLALGQEIARLEGTEAGYCTASGEAAIDIAIQQICNHGDRIVSAETIYGGTYKLFKKSFKEKNNIEVVFVDITDHKAVEKTLRATKAKVLFVETFANPTLVISDIPRLAKIAHRNGAKLVVDNTFTPLIVRPAFFGADVVVHSLTKYINGEANRLGGSVCGTEAYIASMFHPEEGQLALRGPVMDWGVAANILMRLPHLKLRMQEHSRRAMIFSRYLEGRGYKVIYPGLPSHPQHQLAIKLSTKKVGFGGMMALDFGDDAEAGRLFIDALSEVGFGWIAVSLGYFDTLMCRPGSSTSSEIPKEEQSRIGVSPGLVRLSVGYSDMEYLDDEARLEQLKRGVQLFEYLKKNGCQMAPDLTDTCP